jgi:hypothetical protein
MTYSELVAGIDFRLPTVNQGRPLRLGVPEWTELHRAIVGDFCGHLCLETYTEAKFMGSALVVSQETGQPSEGYWNLMREIGVLSSKSETEMLTHWVDQTQKAYAFYGSQPTA